VVAAPSARSLGFFLDRRAGVDDGDDSEGAVAVAVVVARGGRGVADDGRRAVGAARRCQRDTARAGRADPPPFDGASHRGRARAAAAPLASRGRHQRRPPAAMMIAAIRVPGHGARAVHCNGERSAVLGWVLAGLVY